MTHGIPPGQWYEKLKEETEKWHTPPKDLDNYIEEVIIIREDEEPEFPCDNPDGIYTP